MPKDKLHQLIHSLSTSEKAYYIKSKEDSHHTILFNVMNKLEKYDRTVLEKRLNKHPELLKHLSKYKNDLYSDIIKVMRHYRQEKSPSVDNRLRVYLADISFLMERGLYENAMKILKDAKKLATKHEKYEIILEIIRHEISMVKRLHRKDFVEITQALTDGKNKIISIINDEQGYINLYNSIYYQWQRLPRAYTEDRKQYLDELMNNELLLNQERAISFISQYRYHGIYSIYYGMINDRQKRYESRKKILDSWNSHPHQKQEDILTYIGHVSNYLNSCVELKKHAIFEEVLQKVKKEIKPKNSYEQAAIFEILYYTELLYYGNTAAFERLYAFFGEIKPMLKKYSTIMTAQNLDAFRIVIADFLFMMGKYNEANEAFDEFLKQKIPIRLDHQYCARLIKLAMAHEQGDEGFDNLYRSTQRFFRKKNQDEIHKGYQLFMEFLSRAGKSPASETKALFTKYKSEIEKAHAEAPASVLFEILLWMEHMLTKESMEEIMKRQVAI